MSKMFKIKNRVNGKVIFSTYAESIGEAVEKAIENKVSLRLAKLRGADLSGRNLSYGDFQYADLTYANLNYCKVKETNFKGAILKYTHKTGLDLSQTILF